MGNYGITTIEIAEAIDECLDTLEGDFTEEQLYRALDVMYLYPFVSDKKKSVPKYKKGMVLMGKLDRKGLKG